MKKTMLFATLTAAMLMAILVVSASGAAILRADVPFAFHVGNQVLPAGQYKFEMRPLSSGSATASSVQIVTPDGIVTMLIQARAAATDPGKDQLQFNRYGDQYFLTQVECLGHQANVWKGKAEKEMQASGRGVQAVTLLALK